MNKIDLTLIAAIVAILIIAGGYAAYTGTMGNSGVQVQAQNNICTTENCTGNCTAKNCIENQNFKKLNCTGNCTANTKHQRNRNCANK